MKENKMTMIAVATDHSKISEHFGLCEDFVLFTTDGKKISNVEKIANPGHRPCELPDFVAKTGAKVIITGAMGTTAVANCNSIGLEVVVGASGDVEEEVKKFLKGQLVSTDEFCDAWTCEFFFHESCV